MIVIGNSAFFRFFRYFPKLFAAGLMYSASAFGICLLFQLITRLMGIENIILTGLGLIPSAPMLAGLVAVVRRIGAEKKDVPLMSTFFTAVKENCSPFLFHGLVLYLIVACSVFAVLYYGAMSASDVVYSAMLVLYVSFIAVLTAAMFYIPVLTVSYEMKLGEIYKTVFTLIMAMFARSLCALLLTAAVSAAVYFGFILTDGALRIAVCCVAGALYPLLFTYISVTLTAKELQENLGSFV